MLKIKTHNPTQARPANSFYILNKGKNSGRPSETPNVNCFIAICENENDKEYYYWLLWGLWKSYSFYPYLKGSCIEFIRIADVYEIVEEFQHKINRPLYLIAAKKAAALDTQLTAIAKKIEFIKKLRHALIMNELKR